jgi:hypothetical protein
VQKKWRRGQDSNLHSLSAGGFQDRKVGLNLIRPPRIYQYKSGCAAITVIEVMVGSFPSARHFSAKFSKTAWTAVLLEKDRKDHVNVGHMNRKRIPYGTKLPVFLTRKELEDIRECVVVGDEFGRHAVVEGKRLRLDLSLDDIEELQGHVAAESNHTRDKKMQQRLDKIFAKLQKFLDTYDDQE